jgi:hypothetical protein
MRILMAVVAAVSVVGVGGCGYHFAAEGSGLPAQAKTIYVERFGNKSRFTGINDEFMRYLRDEIADHKRLELVDSASQADLVLRGDILFSGTQPISFNSVNEPTQYDQTISADATLTDTHSRQVLWSSHGVTATQHYSYVSQTVVTTSPIFLQQNLRSQDIAALPDIQVAQTQSASSKQQMMTELAQNLYASMSEGF